MSVESLYDDRGSVSVGCLYCTTSDTAFGPVFTGELARLDDFLSWLTGDPRDYSHNYLVEMRDKFWAIEKVRDEARQGYHCQYCDEVVTAGQYDDLQTTVRVFKTPGGSDTVFLCPSCGRDDWDEITLCARCGKAIDDANQHVTCYSGE